MRAAIGLPKPEKTKDTTAHSVRALSRLFCSRLAMSLCALLASVQVSSAEITLTDIAGRTVHLTAPAKRILLAANHYYPALALLSRNSADLVVGAAGSPGAQESGPGFEAGQDLMGKPRLGSIWAKTFSIERALELKPDLLIAAAQYRERASQIESTFAKVGIPIVYVDFDAAPSRNTAPSIEILGRAIGAEKEATELVDFYRRHVSRISSRLEAAKPSRPKFLMMARGPDGQCCFASANGGVLDYFDGLGLSNIADGAGPGRPVQLSLEYVIEKDPDVVVVKNLRSGPGSLFGQPPSLAQGKASLESLRSERRLRDLSAMRNRRVHAIDLFLLNSPLSILTFEALAKWLHPELFADVDPQATLDEINGRFLKTPLRGPFWVSLDPASDKRP